MAQDRYGMNLRRHLFPGTVEQGGPPSGDTTNNRGFTLVEITLVVAIIGILAAVSIPTYQDQVTRTKAHRAMGEIRTISNEITAYSADNGGALPNSLADIRRGGLLDPWNRPYVYYNFASAAPAPPAAAAPLQDNLAIELNKDFDLYSLGPNGVTAVVGGVPDADDDIVRSNDGVYIDLRE